MKEIVLQSKAPLLLRFYVLVPLSVVFIVASGLLFALPAGPLCDEGMVLFMEGGCDMGESNVFFLSKLGALVVVNIALIFASRQKPFPLSTFVPHFALLCWLGWQFRSGGRCDTYYSHPNGSIGQMALELLAFAVLGLALLPFVRSRRGALLAAVVLLWNGLHVGAFYGWLLVTDHWSWAHTWLVATTLLVAAMGVAASQSPKLGMARMLHLSASLSLLLTACAASDEGRLMTWGEYARVEHPIPYVIRLGEPSGGELLYFGARHMFDPDHPQVDQIMRLWEEFQPTLAFYEGGGPAAPPGDTMEQAVRRGAEPGLVRYLAQTGSVRAESPEPDQTLEVDYLSRNYSAEQVKLFYVLRQVSQYLSYANRELGVPLEEKVLGALEAFGTDSRLDGRPRNLDELEILSRELLPPLNGWRDVTLEFFRPNPDDQKQFTNRISAALGDLRDAHIAERIIEAVRSGERLFVVMGSSHPVRQEGLLRRALEPRPVERGSVEARQYGLAGDAVPDLPLNSCPQPRDRLVPLIRNPHEVIPGLRNRAGSDGEPALPANTLALDHAGMLQHVQVLGNCLAC